MKDLIDRVVDFENEVIESLEEKYPRFTRLYVGFYNGKRYGLQLVDDYGNRKDYTLKFYGNRMSGYEEGIKDVCLTSRCRESFIEDVIRDYKERFVKKPLSTIPGYTWNSFKAFLRGDVKIGSSKYQ